MQHYTCPFCYITYPLDFKTFQDVNISFDDCLIERGYSLSRPTYSDKVVFQLFRCPSCNRTAIEIEGKGEQVSDLHLRLNPLGINSKDFPDYIPNSILKTYREACAISQLSPKASATLSRRTLQNMIRDFFKDIDKIPGRDLNSEIDSIKESVSPNVSKALKALKDIGNIGAHPSRDINLIVDVEPGEAETMLKFIEYLFKEWYINKHDTDLLLSDVQLIAQSKKNQNTN
ncbi:DUF4145 domain-containing protein [Lactococcus lactis]|uniref:DUF4145 domain-containing protein n=1 Tax=Lactococcus lactis TaxID=1358 RepID=UPI0018AC2CBE|nr:DUF4145 domain-containing protein [Lactococcus lactis]